MPFPKAISIFCQMAELLAGRTLGAAIAWRDLCHPTELVSLVERSTEAYGVCCG
jgi:hypothetical protein